MIKISLVGQFPPPIHGLSKALNQIYTSKYLSNKYEFEKIDIKDNFNFFSSVLKILTSKSEIFYFTISQSKMGNIRDLLFLFLMILKRKKILIHYHGGYYKQLFNEMSLVQKFLNLKILSKVNYIIVLSESLKEMFHEVVDENKLLICENSVEEDTLLNNSEIAHKLNNIKDIHVLYLSNFIKTKGYLDVLEAANLTENNQRIYYHFAGSFFDEESKDKFLRMTSNMKNVDYHGIVDGENKKDLFKLCSVFILPTYYPKEGQPISLLESMANGCLVITTKHAGIPDIIGTENGYFVDPKNSKQIAKILKNLELKFLLETCNYNREYTLKSFKEEDYINRIDSVFKRVNCYEN